MKNKKRMIFTVFALFAFVFATQGSFAFDAAKTFNMKCAGCHSIGGGKLVGPDLKDVTKRRSEDWLIKFIQSPSSLIESGDADAVQLFNEFNKMVMPDQTLSEDEVKQILKFIESGGVATGQAGSVKEASAATPEEILAGRQLFLGLKGFANGGPACLSCHSVGNHGALGGGTLGLNLTNAYSKYQDNGLNSALSNISFPNMIEVYKSAALTEDEVFQLKAFLYDADKKGVQTGDFQKKFLFLGVGGTVLMLGVFDFIWRKRRKSSVRKPQGGIR